MEFEFWRLFPLILSAPAQTAFVVIYASRRLGAGNWWSNIVGRALFLKSLTLAVLLDIIVFVFAYNWITGAYDEMMWKLAPNPAIAVIVLGYWFVAASIYYQLWALVKNRYFEDDE